MSERNSDEMMVLRTVYLPVRMDAALRDLAHHQRKSKNDLIRAAVANRLLRWTGEDATARIEDDMQLVLRFG